MQGFGLSPCKVARRLVDGYTPCIFLSTLVWGQNLHASCQQWASPVVKHTLKVATNLDQGSPLADGYAPFCKHVFVPNFVGARLGALPITGSNRQHLQCGYSRRRPEELAVLTRSVAGSDFFTC